MDTNTKLGVTWMAIGAVQIIVAHFFIARKQDIFADPNIWLTKKWMKSMSILEEFANYAMDANLIERRWAVDLTVSLMTKTGICSIIIGGTHFLFELTTTGAIVLSSISFVVILGYAILSSILKFLSNAKNRTSTSNQKW